MVGMMHLIKASLIGAAGVLTTVNDTCTNGVCAGINPCNSVTCVALGSCYNVGSSEPFMTMPIFDILLSIGVCIAPNGTCTRPLKPAGSACNDGLANTINDTCNTAGLCTGIDPCVGISCPTVQCYGPPSCSLGTCSAGPQAADGTACSTGNPLTVGGMVYSVGHS